MLAMQEHTLLTLREAAQQLGISRNTARRLIERRELQAIMVGGRIKVRQSEIDRFLNRNIITDDK